MKQAEISRGIDIFPKMRDIHVCRSRVMLRYACAQCLESSIVTSDGRRKKQGIASEKSLPATTILS